MQKEKFPMKISVYDEKNPIIKKFFGDPIFGERRLIIGQNPETKQIYYVGILGAIHSLGDPNESIRMIGILGEKRSTNMFGQGGTMWVKQTEDTPLRKLLAILYKKMGSMGYKHALFFSKDCAQRGRNMPIPLEPFKALIPFDPFSLTTENQHKFLKSLGRSYYETGINYRAMLGLDTNFGEDQATSASEGAPELLAQHQPLGHGVTKYGCNGFPFNELGITGRGTIIATRKLHTLLGKKLKNSCVAINGIGGPVGYACFDELQRDDVTIICASDKTTREGEVVYNKDGLDYTELDQIIRLRKENPQKHTILRYNKPHQKLRLGKEFSIDCDILVLAGGEDMIDKEIAKRINAKIVIEAANCPMSEDAWRVLFEKGVIVLPYFLINVGGTLAAWIETKYRHILTLEEKVKLAYSELNYHFDQTIPELIRRKENCNLPEGIIAKQWAMQRFEETKKSNQKLALE